MYVEGGVGDNLGQSTEIMDPNIDTISLIRNLWFMYVGETVNLRKMPFYFVTDLVSHSCFHCVSTCLSVCVPRTYSFLKSSVSEHKLTLQFCH